MDNYPIDTWADEDIKKMLTQFVSSGSSMCPVCNNKVNAKKEEGEEYLKRKYAQTHYFVVLTCGKCNRHAVQHCKK
jgi:uncharacterized protein with PIN domain